MQSLGLAPRARECRKPWRPPPFLASALLGAALLAAAGPAVGQGNTWQEPSSLSIPRRLLAAAADGDKIYTFGGCGSPCFAPPLHTSTTEERRVEVYDGQRWTIKNRIPAIVFGAAAAAGNDHHIYLFGGYLTGNATWQYTPTTDSWSRKANLPTPRFGLAAVALNGKIYVLGGSNGTSPSRALEVYDPRANTWETKTPMPTARVFLGAAALGRKIYAVGGAPDCCGNAVTSVLEIYDPDTDRWTSGAPLPVAQQVSAAAGVEGRIFTFGGFIPGVGVQGATFEYDPATNAWTAKAPMPLARDQAPAVVFGGQVHVLGGSVDCHCQALATHQSYTPDHVIELPADLAIVKSDHGVTEVIAGHPAGYQIDVTNHGPKAVVGAIVRDFFPPQLKDAMWTCAPVPGTPTGRCSPSGTGSIDDHQVDLPVGSKVRYVVSGTIGTCESGMIENEATVDPPPGIDDRNMSNNRSVDRNSIVGGVPPRITKSDGRDAVAPGDMPVYQIVVSNDCPTSVTVTVTDHLLASGLTAVRWCRGVDCTPSNEGDLTDSVSIPAHGSVTYRATGTVPCPCNPAQIENQACVQALGQAPVCATDVDRIEPIGADLSVALTGPAVVSRGGEADYQVDIHNAGPCTATGVRLEFPPPDGLDFKPGPGLCGTGFPCPIDPIPAGEDVVVTARFKVNEDAACATVPANVHVTSPCDHNGSNDSSSVSTRVACLEIAKTDGLATAPPGATLAYTITVTNPDTAESLPVRVMDAFPKELLEPTWCQGADCVPFLPGDLMVQTDLPAGGSTVYRAQGVVSCLFSGTLANTAKASTLGLPAIQASATDETEIVPDPGVTGCCAGIEGVFVEGQMITYTFVLWNGGPEIQNDNPGPEFEDVLPPGLMFFSVGATRGIAMEQPANTARWDGVLFPGENVIIRVTAKINGGTAGTTICNQGTFYFDADGNGTNESIGLTDDPFLPGTADPCCIDIAIGIPALSDAGVAALVLLLCAGALWQLRTQGTDSVACRRETPRRPARR